MVSDLLGEVDVLVRVRLDAHQPGDAGAHGRVRRVAAAHKKKKRRSGLASRRIRVVGPADLICAIRASL